MKKCRKKALFSGLLCAALSSPAVSADLMEIYLQALHNDPKYQIAQINKVIAKERLQQSKAYLLPHISAAAHYRHEQTQDAMTHSSCMQFNTQDYRMTCTQPLFDLNHWTLVQQAELQSKQVDAHTTASSQDLIFRVAESYLRILEDQDNKTYTKAVKAVYATQLHKEKTRLISGLCALPTVYQIESYYETAKAQEIATQTQLQHDLVDLQQLTGKNYTHIEGFKSDLVIEKSLLTRLRKVNSKLEKNNYDLQSARFAVAAARENIKAIQANHYPTLQLIASMTESKAPSYVNPQQNNAELELQMEIPLFQGGLISSQVREAQAQLAIETVKMRATYYHELTQVQQTYNVVLAGIDQLQADKNAIQATKKATQAAAQCLQSGTITVTEFLTCEQNEYQAQLNYAKDKYNVLLAELLLKKGLGVLNVADLQGINQWLH